MKQTTLWGDEPVKRGAFSVYHDESEPNKRWLLIGLLFVSRHRLDAVRQVLYYHRNQENCASEIHFAKLPKSFGGEFGAKARTARRWLQAYQQGMFEDAHFSALALDRHSPAFDRKRFSQKFHVYNRFTAMAIKSGVVWHLGPHQFDEVELTLVSDAKDRKSQPDQGLVDNFELYIPSKVEIDTWIAASVGGRPYPALRMNPVQLVSSEDDDLAQLTDLILGAVQEALVAGAVREVKLELGRTVHRWCQDLRLPPWKQGYGMHRKFNVWGFPDSLGRPFNNLRFALDSESPSLFDLGSWLTGGSLAAELGKR